MAQLPSYKSYDAQCMLLHIAWQQFSEEERWGCVVAACMEGTEVALEFQRKLVAGRKAFDSKRYVGI